MDAFSRLYLTHYRAMVMLAFSITGSVAVAEEAVQEAYLQLYVRFDQVHAHITWERMRTRHHRARERRGADPAFEPRA